MRHLKSHRKLGVISSHRRAMLRNMATSFFEHGKIKTTVPRAKELRSIVEKLVTVGKKSTLAARRQLESYLFGEQAAKKVIDVLAERMKDRKGGYTRIVKFGTRFGDGAQLCQLELVDVQEHEAKASAAETKPKKTAKKAKAAPSAE